jgi:hypothetical protein
MRVFMVIRRLWNGRLQMAVPTLLVFGFEFDAANMHTVDRFVYSSIWIFLCTQRTLSAYDYDIVLLIVCCTVAHTLWTQNDAWNAAVVSSLLHTL